MEKRGEILVENVIFLVLNLVFLTILTVFILKQGTAGIVLEQSYAKEIALLIDSAKPGMAIRLDMEEGLEISKANEYPFEKIISFDKNYVKIKLDSETGAEYHYFNDINISKYPERGSGTTFTGVYVLTFSR